MTQRPHSTGGDGYYYETDKGLEVWSWDGRFSRKAGLIRWHQIERALKRRKRK